MKLPKFAQMLKIPTFYKIGSLSPESDHGEGGERGKIIFLAISVITVVLYTKKKY